MIKVKQQITSVLLILALILTMFTISTTPASAATKTIKLTAKASGQTKAVLTWNKISKPYSGYAVFRDGKVIKHFNIKTVKYTDTGLTAGSTHSYQIKSYKATKKTQWYNKKTKKWQNSKPAKKYRGSSRKVTTYSYKTKSNTVKITTALPSYTITFKDGYNNSVIKTVSVTKGKSTTPPSAPAHTGYTFAGWDSTLYNNVTANRTITAKYNINKYTVTFKNGLTNETISTATVNYNSTITFPTAPSIPNYTFSGWDKPNTIKITGNTTIIAKYNINKYTVKFINGITGETISTKTVNHGDTVEFPNPTTSITYNGSQYEFTAWDTDKTTPITSNKIITANYKKITNKYTVTFIDGLTNQEITHMTVIEGNNATPPTPPIHSGYEFVGWNGNYQNIKQNTEIVAQYQKIENITIIFKDGVNNQTLATITLLKGESATPPTPPTHEGYTFVGWDSTNYQNVQTSATITALYNKDIVEPETVFTYKFIDSITGNTIDEGEIAEHGCLTRPNPPQHDDMTFTGWDVSDELMNDVTQNLIINTIYEEKQPQIFKITFVNNITNDSITQNVLEGSSASPPEEPATINTNKVNFKYYFEGWSSNDYINVKHDATITTVYSYEELYCITFYDELDSLDYEWDISNYYRKGTPIQSIPKPTLNNHAGYTFSHWEGDSENALTSNIDMIARFTKSYKVTFRDAITQQVIKFSDNTYQINVPSGGLVGTFPTPPEKPNWQFNGWFKNSNMTEPFNPQTDTITKDTTIYAGYIRTYTQDEENFINTYEGETINIWALNNEYDTGITMPNTYSKTFNISTLINNDWEIYVNDTLINMNSYNINDLSIGTTSLYNLLIDDGNLVARYRYVEQTGLGVFCDRDSKYYDDPSYYVPENNIFKRYDYGLQTVKAKKGSREFTFYINVNDYADVWADEQVSELMPLAFNEWLENYGGKSKTYKYLDENQDIISTITITTPTTVEGMSNHQKMTAISYYLTNHYDYSVHNYTDIYTLINHAGDCWGNSKIICRAANLLGMKSHVHMMDSNITRGHQIAAVDLGDDNVGIYDAGTSNSDINNTGISKAPRPLGMNTILNKGVLISASSVNEEIPDYSKKGYTIKIKNDGSNSIEVNQTNVNYIYEITDFDTFKSGTVTLPSHYSIYDYQYQDLDNTYIRGPIKTVKIHGINLNNKGFSPIASIRILSQLTNDTYIRDLLIKDNTKVTKLIVPNSYLSIPTTVNSDLTKLNAEYTNDSTYTIDYSSIEP